MITIPGFFILCGLVLGYVIGRVEGAVKGWMTRQGRASWITLR